MSTETTNKKIKIDNGTTFGRTYTDKAIDAKLPTDLIASANKLSLGVGTNPLGNGINLSGFTYEEATKTLKAAAAGGDAVNIITLNDITHFDGDIRTDKLNVVKDSNGSYYNWVDRVSVDENGVLTAYLAPEITTHDGFANISQVKLTQAGDVKRFNNGINFYAQYPTAYYSHFITLTDNTSTFYFTYRSISEEEANTLDSINTALTGKRLLCTGHTNSKKAEYISGEGGNVVVGVVDNSDSSTSSVSIDSSFTISDQVSEVE